MSVESFQGTGHVHIYNLLMKKRIEMKEKFETMPTKIRRGAQPATEVL